MASPAGSPTASSPIRSSGCPGAGPITVARLIAGVGDLHYPWTRGQELAAAIPNARFQRIDGAGHLVQEDAHYELSRLIIGFLEEPDPAGPPTNRS